MRSNAYVFILFLFTAAFVSGCVPSDTTNNPLPEFTVLSTFYTPKDASKIYLWKRTDIATNSLKYVECSYAGKGTNPFSATHPVADLFTCTDTTSKVSNQLTTFISDTAVIEYQKVGDSVNAYYILNSLLSKGNTWPVCRSFITSNGAVVSIDASVEEYYSSTQVSGMQYNDIYLVKYTVHTDSSKSLLPVEAEYQNGSSLSIYFAKLIGPIDKVAKDPKGAILWTEDLVETRNR